MVYKFYLVQNSYILRCYSPKGTAGPEKTAAILQRRLGLLHTLLQLLEGGLMEAVRGPFWRALSECKALLRFHLGESRWRYPLQVQRRLIRTGVLVHGARLGSLDGWLLAKQGIPLDSAGESNR